MNQPIVITGAGGRLGRALCTLPGCVGLTRRALDIADAAAVAAELSALRPRAVINAAAMANVDACETDWTAALRANADGPTVLALACAALGVPFVHVSTDYVFGAEGHARARREGDPPAPVNAYGQSKLLGEQGVAGAGGVAVVVRTAWLFGFPGDFLDRMIQRAEAKGVVQVTEQVGTPTPVRGLALALRSIAGALLEGAALPPVLHVAGAPVCSRAEWVETCLAARRDLAAVAVERVSLGAFAQDAAARPLGTPLDTSLYQCLFSQALDWRLALSG
ncbi:MAG: SDR family oxidoreductase [Caulobacterales bacterium]